MNLTHAELMELTTLRNKATHSVLTQIELNRMLDLVNKSEGEVFSNYLKNAGYSSVNQYKEDTKKDENLLKGLLIIIGAILLADFISNLFKK